MRPTRRDFAALAAASVLAPGLAEAAGKSKRQVEELVARLAPQPPVPTMVRKLPDRAEPRVEASPTFSFGTGLPESSPAAAFATPFAPVPRRNERRAEIAPLFQLSHPPFLRLGLAVGFVTENLRWMFGGETGIDSF